MHGVVSMLRLRTSATGHGENRENKNAVEALALVRGF